MRDAVLKPMVTSVSWPTTLILRVEVTEVITPGVGSYPKLGRASLTAIMLCSGSRACMMNVSVTLVFGGLLTP